MQERRRLLGLIDKNLIPSSAVLATLAGLTGNVLYIPITTISAKNLSLLPTIFLTFDQDQDIVFNYSLIYVSLFDDDRLTWDAYISNEMTNRNDITYNLGIGCNDESRVPDFLTYFGSYNYLIWTGDFNILPLLTPLTYYSDNDWNSNLLGDSGWRPDLDPIVGYLKIGFKNKRKRDYSNSQGYLRITFNVRDVISGSFRAPIYIDTEN